MTTVEATTVFEAHRSRLVRLAYRMLGSLDEAEDIVQDAWLRWRRIDVNTVDDPTAFLVRTVSRLCLDMIKSARRRRETYVGNWLPEPLIEQEMDTFLDDELTLTLMLALERLSPLERTAFLLHDVFDTPLDEIAITIQRDAAAVRQLAVRARKHIQAARPRYPVAREEGERIAEAFFAALHNGNTEMLQTLLAHDVVLRADGGGKVPAFFNPIVGAERIVRLYEGLEKKFALLPSVFIQPMWIDNLPGFVSIERGVFQTTALEIEDRRIVGVYITRNPDKLVRVRQMLETNGVALPPGAT